jgi:hypothetical protein
MLSWILCAGFEARSGIFEPLQKAGETDVLCKIAVSLWA